MYFALAQWHGKYTKAIMNKGGVELKATGCDVVPCCVESTCNQVHSARQEKDTGGICLRRFEVTLDIIINTIQTLTDQLLRGVTNRKVNKLAEDKRPNLV
jgi:hypothetical protein